MKLIVVDRAKLQTFQKLIGQFAGDPNVRVMLDRRLKQIRKRDEPHNPDRRKSERRRLIKQWDGRDYIVVHLADRAASRPPSDPSVP
jgi:hypothetical protein